MVCAMPGATPARAHSAMFFLGPYAASPSRRSGMSRPARVPPRHNDASGGTPDARRFSYLGPSQSEQGAADGYA